MRDSWRTERSISSTSDDGLRSIKACSVVISADSGLRSSCATTDRNTSLLRNDGSERRLCACELSSASARAELTCAVISSRNERYASSRSAASHAADQDACEPGAVAHRQRECWLAVHLVGRQLARLFALDHAGERPVADEPGRPLSSADADPRRGTRLRHRRGRARRTGRPGCRAARRRAPSPSHRHRARTPVRRRACEAVTAAGSRSRSRSHPHTRRSHHRSSQRH